MGLAMQRSGMTAWRGRLALRPLRSAIRTCCCCMVAQETRTCGAVAAISGSAMAAAACVRLS